MVGDRSDGGNRRNGTRGGGGDRQDGSNGRNGGNGRNDAERQGGEDGRNEPDHPGGAGAGSAPAPPAVALDRVTDGFVALDGEWRVTYANRPAGELLGESPESLVGERLWDAYPELVGTRFETEFRAAMETQEPVGFEAYHEPADRWIEVRAHPSETGLSLYARDVTERHEREQELRRYERLVETSPDPMFALDAGFRFTLVNRATEALVGVDRDDLLGEPAATVVESGYVDEEAFAEGMETLRGLVAGDGPDYSKHVASLRTADGGEVVAEYHLAAACDGVVGVVRDVTDHRDQKRRVRRQRDQLETLDRINALVQETIRGVVGAPTREEIEAMVCRRLAESAVYSFAWIGERGPSGGVEFRTGVGVDEEWFERTQAIYDDLDVPDPGRVAMETGEILGSNDVLENPDVPPAAIEAVPGDGLRSGVVVPLRYADAVYGVLAVASPRPDAFSEREEAAFEVLGEVIGFAINATGNRRLLLGDAAAEVELRVPDESEPFVGLAAALDCRVDLERAVPTAGDGVVHYVNVVGVPAPAVEAHLDDADGVTGVRTLREGDDGAFLAVTAAGTAPARLVAAGATPGTFVAADGVARVTAEVPPGTDVHAVLEAVHETFEGSRVTAKRFVDRPPGARKFAETVADRLTERQHDALGAALSAGYYDWPRESTAEEVADSLDISSATLHYHLRRAEAELVRAVLGGAD